MKSNTLEKGMKNIIYSLVYQLITIGLGILIPRLVIVSLGSEANGLLNSINQVIVYLALLEGGIGLTITKALYGPIATKDVDELNGIMSASNIFYKKIGILYFIGILFIAIVYPFIIETTISKLTVFIVIILTGLPQVINFLVHGKFRTLMSVDGKGYVLTKLSTVVYVLTSISKIILLLNGFGIIAIQLLYLIVNLLQMIFITYYVKKEYPWLNLKVKPMNEKIGKRKSVFLHQISGFIFSNTDLILISYFCDLKLVSVYAMYNMFFSMINTLASSFTSGFVFSMGQKFNTDRHEFIKLNRLFESLNMTIVFSLQCVTYICILPFLKIYTHGITDVSYIDSYLPILFSLLYLLQSGRYASQKVIEYAGEFENTQGHAVIEVIVNVVISIVGVKLIGIYGVLLGTVSALLVRSVLMIYYSNKKILGQSQTQTYIKWGVNLTLFFVFSLTMKNILQIVIVDTYVSIIIFAFFTTVVSIILFFIANVIVDYSSFVLIKKLIKK